jgi:hypothetical protein
MFNKLVPSGKNIIYRKAVWLYLFLLIFEGALRRWLLPSLATPLLIVRDPIVVWLVLVGWQKGWLKNGYVAAMMIVSTVSLFLTMFVGHQSLLTAIYGWRSYFFYFPFIFVIGHILTREDLLKMGRFILYLSIPMTVLIVIQFYSPQSAWVNRGVGGDMEGAGFGGALGYFRSPGTFTFSTGFACFQLVVACYLFYYLLANKSLQQKYRIKIWLLWIMLGCFLISIPYSISRTHFFQSLVILSFVAIAGFVVKQYKKRIITMVVFAVLAISVIVTFNMLGDSLDAFTARFESASESEGGLKGTLGNRYFGSILRGIDSDFPTWGYGIGYGSNVGAKLLGFENMYSKFNSDQEWVRVVGECGLLIGLIIMLIRIIFSISLFFKSFHCLKYQLDILPWLFSSGILMFVMMGQFNVTSSLGFAGLVGGLGVAAVKPSIITKNIICE